MSDHATAEARPLPALGVLTTRDLMRLLRCSKQTVYRMVKLGMPCIRFDAAGDYYYVASEVERWFASQCRRQVDAGALPVEPAPTPRRSRGPNRQRGDGDKYVF